MTAMDRYTCEHVFTLMEDYLDKELTRQDMQRVQEHLDICIACASEYRFQADTIAQIRRRLQHIYAPAGLLARVSEALRNSSD